MILINVLRKGDLIYVHLINIEEAIPNAFLFLSLFFFNLTLVFISGVRKVGHRHPAYR